MVRPQWIAALLLALIVAGIFAWLGRWQLESAIQGASRDYQTEVMKKFTDIASPGEPISEAAGGSVVEVDGSFADGDFNIVSPRVNGDESGAWVVAHLLTDEPAGDEPSHLAVAVGWAPDVEAAAAAIKKLSNDPEFHEAVHLEGRYMPTESPVIPHPDEDPQSMLAMVPSQQMNSWKSVASPSYAGYLVMHPNGVEGLLSTAGLDPIDSVPPIENSAVNWLNAFYAIEWVVFAGAALFMWYRLARDAWEREHEYKLLKASEAEKAATEAAAALEADHDRAQSTTETK